MLDIDRLEGDRPDGQQRDGHPLEVHRLGGLWRRSLLAYPDGVRDTTSHVHWLQGPTLFADLRQGAGRPDFAGVRRLRDLSAGQVAWLGGQEGFAGRLVKVDGFFEWRRDIDFQPPSSQADAGRLWMEDLILKEEGRDIPYLEHWHRETAEGEPAAAFALRDAETGAAGALVVVGPVFMHVRDRAAALPPGARLTDLTAAAPDLAQAQDLVDCEISAGTVEDGVWTIRTSSLPFREGQALRPLWAASGDALTVADQTAEGTAFERRWLVTQREGTGVTGLSGGRRFGSRGGAGEEGS